ncbi:hypothetical protein [uncultured Sneathiella sp.]|mgnify:FL=1|uniref:hypothetical protein n=1 Tax=uncultured Sneathiella sp. TaxID=879315 RepID=UPI0030D6E644
MAAFQLKSYLVKIVQLSDLKAKIKLYSKLALRRIRRSSRRERINFSAPFVAALLFAGATVLLDIYLRGAPVRGYLLELLGVAGMLACFFVPLTYVSLRLYRKVWPRLRQRRFSDAFRVGLYLPHAFAVLVILAAELEGSENITSLGGAIILWAMLSLLLTPFSVLVTMLVWSYLPKELRVPNGLLQISSRLNPRGQNLLSAPETHDEGDADAVRT